MPPTIPNRTNRTTTLRNLKLMTQVWHEKRPPNNRAAFFVELADSEQRLDWAGSKVNQECARSNPKQSVNFLASTSC